MGKKILGLMGGAAAVLCIIVMYSALLNASYIGFAIYAVLFALNANNFYRNFWLS